MKLIKSLKSKITEGDPRSVKAKKNIVGMMLLKGGNILIGLLLVPMTLHYVDSECYGIWLTLSSMVAWISFFDIGISNGLRNRLTEALALGDMDLCQKYVSTTYAILTLIFVPLMAILLLVLPLVDLGSLLNVSASYSTGLLISVSIIVSYFCLNLILSTVNTVILAEQRPADAALRHFFEQLASLAVIFLLTKLTQGSLVLLCIGLCAAPLTVTLLFNFTLFGGRYKCMRPLPSKVDFRLAPNLLKLGLQFFIIQIAAIIQYQAINFILLRYYGATEVTNYNVSNKYFSVLMMVWGILIAPLWSATTDALANKDIQWVRRAQAKYLKLFILFAVGGTAMLLVSPWIYDLWVGKSVHITFNLSLWVLLYNLSMMLGMIFVMIVNGSGDLKVQARASMISPFVFIGFCALFIYLRWGIYSVLIAAILSNFNGLILAPWQCVRLCKQPSAQD